MLLLALTLAAAPAQQWTVTLHHVEKLVVKTRGRVTPDDTTFDAKGRVTFDSMKGERPDAITVVALKKEFPKAFVKDDSGAPVVTFEGDAAPPLGIGKILKRLLGRLIVDDEERGKMSSCTADTEAATQRWLQRGVARTNGSDPSDVTISDLKLKCAANKTGTKLDVAFSANVPRGTMSITLQAKGTLTVDRAIWVTQWKFEGPVHATSESADFAIDGTFASSLSVAR